jgi:hypothetical protein
MNCAISYLGQEFSVHLTRYDDTDNRFLFAQEELVAISIEDFPLEHWFPHHIIHSTAPFACRDSLKDQSHEAKQTHTETKFIDKRVCRTL